MSVATPKNAVPAPVTIVVPTRNGGPLFRRVIARIAALDPPAARVIVIDSGSSDGTADHAREAGADVLPIDPATFDHGATRMIGVERAGTPLVAFLSQDALPDADYLGPLVAAFDDPRVAGATARILPQEDASPLARRSVLASPMAGSEPRTIEVDPARFAALDGRARRAFTQFDNVASMARRDLLLRHPFPRTMMGEDAAFAAAALAAGHRLRFEPGSVVRHSHEYGPISAFRRYRDDARFLRRSFGEVVRPTPWDVVRGFAYEVREDARAVRGTKLAAALKALAKSPFVRAGQIAGQWWGGRAGARP